MKKENVSRTLGKDFYEVLNDNRVLQNKDDRGFRCIFKNDIIKEYDGGNIKKLSKKYGFTEQEIIDVIKDSIVQNEEELLKEAELIQGL